MSVALKKADGDLFIDPATGRGEEISGPTKVDQELFSLYTTDLDVERNWGSQLNLKFFKGITSMAEFRSRVFFELNSAHNRYNQKQAKDLFLDIETEEVRGFSRADVVVDPASQGALFITEAEVGDSNTAVGKTLFIDFKPLSIRHVMPPPFADGLKFF